MKKRWLPDPFAAGLTYTVTEAAMVIKDKLKIKRRRKVEPK